MKRHFIAAAIAATCLATLATAQVPKELLLKPPSDARQFVVMSAAGPHGTYAAWKMADGTLATRQSMLLRGFVWETDQTIRLGPSDLPERIEVRGIDPGGNAAELFEVTGGTAKWKSPQDSGELPFDGSSLYVTADGAWGGGPHFIERLARAPGKKLKTLPGGEARLTRLVDIPVGSGASAKLITAWALDGLFLDPQPVLLDQEGHYFGMVDVLGILPPDYAGDFLKIQKAQNDALAARTTAAASRFRNATTPAIAFTNVKLFDAVVGRFIRSQTVVTDGGLIAAIGSTETTRIPPGAKVIDGGGKTLVPGLWDAHMHTFGADTKGLMLLSMGETSARDPGAEIAKAIDRNARIERGELMFPTVYSSILIDGKGPLQAQVGMAVASADEAAAAVRMAKDNGFTGVKFYTSMKPDWLRAGIAEAKRLGLHVHGHVPATMRPMDAIEAGYDEITHINMMMMQAMPDSVVSVSNSLARFEGPGRYAKDVDVEAEPLKSLLSTMAAKQIVSDPTLSFFEQAYVPESGTMSSAYTPFAGTMPPQMERQFRAGGLKLPDGVTRSDYRASFAKLLRLVGTMREAGVPIVAGTDGWGIELVRELELYVEAGFTPAQALQTATINPARLVKADNRTGSIAVGKEADLVLVDGDPETNIGDLRKTEWVMSDGLLMDADELREAAGFSGRPH